MKWAVRTVLLLFMTFLATPTVVSLIKNNCDTSCFYSFSEEELAHKELKADLNWVAEVPVPHFPDGPSGVIESQLRTKHDNISCRILIPPPERA